MPHYVTTSTIKFIPIAGLMNRKKMTVPITVQTASPVLCWNLWFTTWNRQWHILLSLDGNLRIEIVETFNHSDKSPTCCRNIGSDKSPTCQDEGSLFHTSNHHPANFFVVLKMLSAYCTCCMYLNALKTNMIMEANTMNPDQTAPSWSGFIVCFHEQK